MTPEAKEQYLEERKGLIKKYEAEMARKGMKAKKAYLNFHEQLTGFNTSIGNDSLNLIYIDEIMDSIKFEFNQLMDAGNTPFILGAIRTRSQKQPAFVIEVLDNFSPYLSHKTLITFLDHSEHFREEEIIYILIQNGHALTNDRISKIISCDNFTESNMEKIRNADKAVARVRKLRSKGSSYGGVRSTIVRRGMEKAYGHEQRKFWLSQSRGGNSNFYLGAAIYDKEGEAAYRDFVNGLKNQSNDQLEKFADIELIQSVRGLKTEQLTESQISKLKSIANKPPSVVTTWARNTCKVLFDMKFPQSEYNYPCIKIKFKDSSTDQSEN
jgi:hypothetical protein